MGAAPTLHQTSTIDNCAGSDQTLLAIDCQQRLPCIHCPARGYRATCRCHSNRTRPVGVHWLPLGPAFLAVSILRTGEPASHQRGEPHLRSGRKRSVDCRSATRQRSDAKARLDPCATLRCGRLLPAIFVARGDSGPGLRRCGKQQSSRGHRLRLTDRKGCVALRHARSRNLQPRYFPWRRLLRLLGWLCVLPFGERSIGETQFAGNPRHKARRRDQLSGKQLSLVAQFPPGNWSPRS